VAMTEAGGITDEEAGGYAGAIIVEWPGPPKHGVGAIAGRAVTIYDAFSGDEPHGSHVTTVSSADIVIHAEAEGLVTADLTMFADEAGHPVFDGKPHFRDGEVITATFTFLVADMRTQAARLDGKGGKVAYVAYGEVTGGKNYQGLPMPAWDELPATIQDAWVAAAQAVIDQHA
jgi:hypothetical protein